MGADVLFFWLGEQIWKYRDLGDANGSWGLELGTLINVRFEPSKEIKAWPDSWKAWLPIVKKTIKPNPTALVPLATRRISRNMKWELGSFTIQLKPPASHLPTPTHPFKATNLLAPTLLAYTSPPRPNLFGLFLEGKWRFGPSFSRIAHCSNTTRVIGVRFLLGLAINPILPTLPNTTQNQSLVFEFPLLEFDPEFIDFHPMVI